LSAQSQKCCVICPSFPVPEPDKVILLERRRQRPEGPEPDQHSRRERARLVGRAGREVTDRCELAHQDVPDARDLQHPVVPRVDEEGRAGSSDGAFPLPPS
jgi:hypothetical protein